MYSSSSAICGVLSIVLEERQTSRLSLKTKNFSDFGGEILSDEVNLRGASSVRGVHPIGQEDHVKSQLRVHAHHSPCVACMHKSACGHCPTTQIPAFIESIGIVGIPAQRTRGLRMVVLGGKQANRGSIEQPIGKHEIVHEQRQVLYVREQPCMARYAPEHIRIAVRHLALEANV